MSDLEELKRAAAEKALELVQDGGQFSGPIPGPAAGLHIGDLTAQFRLAPQSEVGARLDHGEQARTHPD